MGMYQSGLPGGSLSDKESLGENIAAISGTVGGGSGCVRAEPASGEHGRARTSRPRDLIGRALAESSAVKKKGSSD